jgi:flagellar biosynthesis component FlhA
MADFGSVIFTELHLFPRTLFALGAALFISSLVPPLAPPKFPVALLGLGLIFFVVGFNILYDLVRSWKQVFEQRDKESDTAATARKYNESVQRIVLWVESAAAILIALVAFCWAAHRYYCGV